MSDTMEINVLIIGSGGREHALAWKLAQSPRVKRVYCAPGNGGTATLGENVAIGVDDHAGLVQFARDNEIGLVVIGPDDALAAGIVDAFDAAGIRAFGPRAEAARLESSKIFAKDFMRRHGIPTAAAQEFSDSSEAHRYCLTQRYPMVIKADGLALGKGVTIAQTPQEAALAIHRAMEMKIFGEAGCRVVIEEFLVGPECSIHALVDGTTAQWFPDCRDHKQAFDGGVGPNTGGMGTICPSGAVGPELQAQIQREVLDRFMAGIQADKIPFRGMLFPGLVLTADGPKVLEFNCRWGDPETQVLVRRLESDLLELLMATVDGRLGEVRAEWAPGAAACIVLASGGYPGAYAKGMEISGLDQAESSDDGVVVFHAGTVRRDRKVWTSGGRVLGVTAIGPDLQTAVDRAYSGADKIHFDNLQRRNDIGRA